MKEINPKVKAIAILADALDFYPEKVAEIMDEVDSCIKTTTDETIIKQLYHIWNELDSLKTELVNCSKFFKYFFKEGEQQ